MSDLAALIRADFPAQSPCMMMIEVYIIDGNGDPFEVYRGYSSDLTAAPLLSVMNKTGTLYFFSVIGIHKDIENEIDSYKGLVVMKDYSWLSEPSDPILVSKTQSSITVKWDQVVALGLVMDHAISSVIYSVEVAEGQAWCMKTNDVIFVPKSEKGLSTPWITVASGADLNCLEIAGLQAATWYHVRLAVTCRGIKRISRSISVATSFDAPLAPTTPRLYVNPHTDVDGSLSPQVLVRWSAPLDNGADIIMYQVQLMAVDKNGNAAIGDRIVQKEDNNNKLLKNGENKEAAVEQKWSSQKLAPVQLSNDRPQSPTKPARPYEDKIKLVFAAPHTERFLITSFQSKNASLTNTRPFELPNVIINGLEQEHIFTDQYVDGYSSWKTIHKNINNRCLVAPPDANVVEYRVRVRAKNKFGWSPYCMPLVANYSSYPGLFHTSTANLFVRQSMSRPTSSSVDMYHAKVARSKIIKEREGGGGGGRNSYNAHVPNNKWEFESGAESSTHLSSILSNEFLEGKESLFSADSVNNKREFEAGAESSTHLSSILSKEFLEGKESLFSADSLI